MAKQAKVIFICGECGYESGKWLGRCPECGSWNTMVEEAQVAVRSEASPGARAAALKDIAIVDSARVSTSFPELDRVLGGGVVAGSVVLIGGDPGIGKSTLLMQVASALTACGKVLYVTGEESLAQLKLRAKRLGVDGEMLLLAQTDYLSIEGEARRIKPAYLIVDSIQTIYSPECSGAPGSVSQVREATSQLTRLAKNTGTAVFIVGHVTKEGAIAGPRVLEHMVDTVLYFEGDRHNVFRLLRAVKNRFGSTNEIGIFEMRDTGMVEVIDPSGLFLSGLEAPGCAVHCAMEGTRPMLVEVQSLINNTVFGNPRRMAAGMDVNRLALLLAVLEKKAGARLSDKDVYINVVGGIKLEERAADLAIAMCVLSGLVERPILSHTAVIGEIGLTGEIRPVAQIDQRIRECARLGYRRIIVPKSAKIYKPEGIELLKVGFLADAAALL